MAIALVLALTGCLGKSSANSGNGGVVSVTLSPSNNLSLDVGGTQFFSAAARDANGKPVFGVDIQFVVGVPPGSNAPAALSVASNGNACAGTWDITVNYCSQGLPGVATVTAVVNGVSSPPTTVYVHQHIDSIQISRLDPQGPPQYDCFSQGQSWEYGATAYTAGTPPVDITNSVGPMSWSSSNAGVVTTSTTVSGLLPNQVQVTANTPGITQLIASVAGTTSASTRSPPA